MTLKQLEYFLEIAKMGSVTRAAQSLNVSQPPVSLQLKLLEEELGSPLFIRDKRHLEITPAGTLLRERAQAILALLEETSRDIQLISQERHMIIRIATIGSINSQMLPEKIAHFCSVPLCKLSGGGGAHGIRPGRSAGKRGRHRLCA